MNEFTHASIPSYFAYKPSRPKGRGIKPQEIKPKTKNAPIKAAFDKSYNERKKGNVFTKVKIAYDADIALTNYFKRNEEKINSWFYVITPKEKKLNELKTDMIVLSNKIGGASKMSAGRKVNSLSQHWRTPRKYVNAVKKMFDDTIELYPCSNKFSIVNARVEYTLPENDGLLREWSFRTIYANPPYGADRIRGTTIKNWLRKRAESHKKRNLEILALIPVATNTAHWKHYILGEATATCFLYDTRLKFIIDGDDENKGAPTACCMAY
ncbi:MAG: phage N-6-adenine-methyltransferase [Treponema sp.]|jgi:hypothetical protein|nr:phage N-6-adenine-methyltransferase [Treponema sp.]